MKCSVLLPTAGPCTVVTLQIPFSVMNPKKKEKGPLFLGSWPWKMGPIGCPGTSVRNYPYLLPHNPAERSSHLCILLSTQYFALNTVFFFLFVPQFCRVFLCDRLSDEEWDLFVPPWGCAATEIYRYDKLCRTVY
jgi:hypothetical protein